MPKMKSRKSATKRFKVTGTGKEQRHLSKEVGLAPEMVPGVKRMLGKR